MSKIGNMSFEALKDYVARVATKTINNGQEFNTVHTGIIQQSLPGYYTVSLTNSNDTTIYNAIPLNSTDTFGANDYVYLVKAPVSSGDNFNTKYYIFGLVTETDETYANLSEWERFMADTSTGNLIASQVLHNQTFTNKEYKLVTLDGSDKVNETFFKNINDKKTFAVKAAFTCLGTNLTDYGLRIKCKNIEGAICQTAEGLEGIYSFGTGWFLGQPFDMYQINQRKVLYLDNFTTSVAKIEVYAYINYDSGKDVFPRGSSFEVRNIELQAGSIKDMSGRFSVRISVPKNGKDYFRSIQATAESQDVVSLQATPYYDTQPLSAESIQYYWFIKDENIKANAGVYPDQYNSLAGEGWRCLNSFVKEPIVGSASEVKVWNNKNNIINIDEYGWKITNQNDKIFGTVAGWEQKNISNPQLINYPTPKGALLSIPSHADATSINKGDYYTVSGSGITGAKSGDIIVALKKAPEGREDWNVIKATITIAPFDKFENIVKCIVKYQGAVASSEEYVVYNYAIHNYKAILNSSNSSNRLILPEDRIILSCTISDLNELAQKDSYAETVSWIIKGRDKETQEWLELDHDLADKSTQLRVIHIKDDDKETKNESTNLETRQALEYELLKGIEVEGVNKIFDKYSVQCYIQISVDAADNAIELYSNTIEIESITELAEDIKTVFVYKYYVSPNMNVTFGKAIGDNGSWNGDWSVDDDGFVDSPWTELKDSEVWLEDNPMENDPRNAINYLSTERSSIWPLDRGAKYKNGKDVKQDDTPYLYYTRKELLYLYKGTERVDYNTLDDNEKTPVEEKNWEFPVMLRQVQMYKNANGSFNTGSADIKNAVEIDQINTFNKLTANGTEDGIFYQENVYVVTSDKTKQTGKTYYKRASGASELDYSYTAYNGAWTESDVYYELADKNKLYINATYINTGTLRVGSDATEMFYASIHSPKVRIGGYTVSKTDLMSADSKVGLSSSDSYAFWAGSATKDSAPFRVTHAGALYATSANITGHIHATSLELDESIQIGGSNLAGGDNLAASEYMSWWGDPVDTSISNFKYSWTVGSNSGGGLRMNMHSLLTAGKKYTLSYKFKITEGGINKIAGHSSWYNTLSYTLSDGTSTVSNSGINYATGFSFPSGFSLGKEYTVEVTFEVKSEGANAQDKDNALYIQPNRGGIPENESAATIEVWNLQFEEGEKASQWKIPVEDGGITTEFKVSGNEIIMAAKTLSLTGSTLKIDTNPLKLINNILTIDTDNLKFNVNGDGKLAVEGAITATSLTITKEAAKLAGFATALDRNLILNSYIDLTSGNYGFGTRGVTVNLQSGKTYTLTANGYITPEGSTGKSLAIYIYHRDWSWSKSFHITSTTASTNSITFTMDRTIQKGDIKVTAYYYPNDSKAGTATVNWVKLEEGNCSTEWTPAPEDTATALETTTEFVVDSAKNMIYLSSKNLAINTTRLKLNHSGTDVQDGYFSINTDNFTVSQSGEILAKKGTVGGWKIGENFQVHEVHTGNPYMELDPERVSEFEYSGFGTYAIKSESSQSSGILLNPTFIQGHYRTDAGRMEYRFKWEDLVKMWSQFLGIKVGHVSVSGSDESASNFSNWSGKDYVYQELFSVKDDVDYFVFVTPNSDLSSAMMDITTKKVGNTYYVGVKRSSNYTTLVSYFAIPWSYYTWR